MKKPGSNSNSDSDADGYGRSGLGVAGAALLAFPACRGGLGRELLLCRGNSSSSPKLGEVRRGLISPKNSTAFGGIGWLTP